ncbi:MAG: hypothetical protein HRT44_02550 [Bdellovibrionales bacterium]|nr:hypothetical protein [Bdellovibrionales bacterium]
MTKLIAGLCLFIAAGLILFMSPPVQFYKQTPSQRLGSLWSNDIARLKQQDDFNKMLVNVGEVELSFTDPQVEDELSDLKSAIKVTKGASLKIRVDVIRWISGNRYGYVLQHDVFDSTDDKVFEFGRTYKVGFIW